MCASSFIYRELEPVPPPTKPTPSVPAIVPKEDKPAKDATITPVVIAATSPAQSALAASTMPPPTSGKKDTPPQSGPVQSAPVKKPVEPQQDVPPKPIGSTGALSVSQPIKPVVSTAAPPSTAAIETVQQAYVPATVAKKPDSVVSDAPAPMPSRAPDVVAAADPAPTAAEPVAVASVIHQPPSMQTQAQEAFPNPPSLAPSYMHGGMSVPYMPTAVPPGWVPGMHAMPLMAPPMSMIIGLYSAWFILLQICTCHGPRPRMRPTQQPSITFPDRPLLIGHLMDMARRTWFLHDRSGGLLPLRCAAYVAAVVGWFLF
jgi:hypothetical protein